MFEWSQMEPDAVVQRAVERGLVRSGATPSRIIVATDLERVVADFTGMPYCIKRTGGEVDGRTLPGPDGEAVVFLGSVLLAQDEAAIERTVVHESGHVLMLQRGEDLPTTVLGHLPQASAFVLQLASIAIAEYRAERMVRRLGYEDASRHEDRLIGLAVEPVEIASDPESADPRAFSGRMAPVLQQYIVVLASAAAWDETPGPTQLVAMFDSGSWQPLIAFLRAIPDAGESIGYRGLLALAESAQPLVNDALIDLGFEWLDGEDGIPYFFRRATAELLTQRLEAAAEWCEANADE